MGAGGGGGGARRWGSKHSAPNHKKQIDTYVDISNMKRASIPLEN